MPERQSGPTSFIRRWLRILALLLFIGYPLGNFLLDFLVLEWHDYQFRSRWPTFYAQYQNGQSALYNQNYPAALESLDQAIASAQKKPGFDTTYLASAYALKGETLVQLWHYIDAEKTFAAALALADDDQKNALRQRLTAIQNHIERNEQERDDKTTYESTTDAGPAKRLRGRVVVVYVFVDDGKLSRWGTRDRQHALSNLSAVEAWYRQRADTYGVDSLSFVSRNFVYDRDPLLRKALQQLSSREVAIASDLAGRVAALAGGSTVNSFLQQVIAEENADQALLLLHINKKARSFALPCRLPCWNRAEYAYLLEKPKRNDWDSILYTQAHEILHLFGADDLYNIASARTYAPRDIMHHIPRYLRTTEIDSITAYAIGWTEHKPQTPFAVQNTGGKR